MTTISCNFYKKKLKKFKLARNRMSEYLWKGKFHIHRYILFLINLNMIWRRTFCHFRVYNIIKTKKDIFIYMIEKFEWIMTILKKKQLDKTWD